MRSREAHGVKAIVVLFLLALPACFSRTGFFSDGDVTPSDSDVLVLTQNGLASTLQHTCSLINDGQAYCWGEGTDGKLGINDTSPQRTPTAVTTSLLWSQLGAGEKHTCGITPARELYCWGDNSHGQLGLGHLDGRSSPTQVGTETDWVRVACGGFNTCALKVNGTLYCWGDSTDGNNGLGDAKNGPPVSAPTLVAGGFSWRAVAMGQGHTCGIANTGSLYCWGRTGNGELGVSTTQPQERAPVRVESATSWLAVAAAQHHTCAIKPPGTLWCWGGDAFGELGQGFSSGGFNVILAPTQVGTFDSWERIALGWFHSCAARDGGALYCWGRNGEGQLGIGNNSNQNTPTALGGFTDWNEIVLGNFHTCATRDSGGLYCWGENNVGQLGVGDTNRHNTPVAVTF